MSTATSENTALDEYLVLGETLFVTGSVLAFLSDIFLTFRTLMVPSGVGVLLGLVFIIGTVYFVNRLYSGCKKVRVQAAGWAAIQIVIALLGVGLLNSHHEVSAQRLAVPSAILGLFKAVAYGVFAYLIVQRTPALFYLRHKGGESVELPSPSAPPEDITPTGVVLPLAADQTATAGKLSSTLQCASWAFLAAGFFQAIAGGQRIAETPRAGWLGLGEGVALLILGLLLMIPSGAVRNIQERGGDTSYIMDSLGKLGGLFTKQTLVTLALIALTIGGISIRWAMKG